MAEYYRHVLVTAKRRYDPASMKSDARLFADYLSEWLGAHDSIRVVNSTSPALPPVCAFFFRDRPGPGLQTIVTYGLSLAEHSDWTDARPELVMVVNSLDEAWGISLATVAERRRGQAAFSEGTTLVGDGEHADGSEMSAFLFATSLAEPAGQQFVQLATRRIVLRGAVPIHECEIELLEKIGTNAFLTRPQLDFFDVERAHLWE